MAGDTADFESSSATAAVQNGHYPAIKKREKMPVERFEQVPLLTAVLIYLGYTIVILFGYISDIVIRLGLKKCGHMEVYDKDVCLHANGRKGVVGCIC